MNAPDTRMERAVRAYVALGIEKAERYANEEDEQ